MAAIKVEDFRQHLQPTTNLGEYGAPGQIPLKEWVRRGNWKLFGKNPQDKLKHCCSRCARLAMPKENPEALASECGCQVNFEGLKYCFRHAFAKRLCRRCGALLPPPQPKKKKKTRP